MATQNPQRVTPKGVSPAKNCSFLIPAAGIARCFVRPLPGKKASKALSQKYWHAKLENWNYWRGRENVERVRIWRKAHSQYWKRAIKKGSGLRYKMT